MMARDRIIDISVAISPSLPVWPGDPQITIELSSSIEQGAPANVSRLHIGTHTGTHLDAPWHFIPSGDREDQLPLDALIGPCWVCDLTHLDHQIEAADRDAASVRDGTRRLLLKTRNSDLWTAHPDTFDQDFIALMPGAARYVVEHGIRLVGIDYPSIEPFDSQNGETHHVLLGAGVIPVETLDPRGALDGAYTVLCLPLKIAGADGAPCRAVLLSPETTAWRGALNVECRDADP
jgi:arylformamidase